MLCAFDFDKLKNVKLTYILRKSNKARCIRLSVNHEAKVVVTLPRFASEIFAEKFVRKNARWILDKIEKFKKSGPIFSLKGSRGDYLANKDKAFKIVQKSLKKFNAFYRFDVRRIAVRNTKSRWGSCSKNGNLNFNYKIAFLPEYLADYLVAHELCHLKEMNHSRRFWDLVAKTVPDYKSKRKELLKIKI